MFAGRQRWRLAATASITSRSATMPILTGLDVEVVEHGIHLSGDESRRHGMDGADRLWCFVPLTP